MGLVSAVRRPRAARATNARKSCMFPTGMRAEWDGHRKNRERGARVDGDVSTVMRGGIPDRRRKPAHVDQKACLAQVSSYFVIGNQWLPPRSTVPTCDE